MEALATIIGYHTADGYTCMNAECLVLAGPVGSAIVEDDASDEYGFHHCSCCGNTLDEKAELAHWMQAPIPTPSWVMERARALGMVAA